MDVHGSAPDGTAANAVMSGDWSGRLIFLTSSCVGCRPVWRSLAPESAVVVVTPSPSTESAQAVAAVAPAGVPVIMSSEGWHAYGVTVAPWAVEVVAGTVVAEGAAGEHG